MWTWITNIGVRRREHKERVYWALREAEAIRMQHGRNAEKVCDDLLARSHLPARRRRFITLVRGHLNKV